MTNSGYDKEFYISRYDRTKKSAETLIPIILDLFKPHSVIDFGCADGIWLSVFKKLGVMDIYGIDGDFVDQESIFIPKDKFLCHDLSTPLNLKRRFDLAISLEVAEHLPTESSEMFIKSIISSSDIIIFSAAIPFQGGVNHINEQWQDYWANLFINNNYDPIDVIRSRIWNNINIASYYRQNLMCYVSRNLLFENSQLIDEIELTPRNPLNLVHPDIYLQKIQQIDTLKKQNNKNIFFKLIRKCILLIKKRLQ